MCHRGPSEGVSIGVLESTLVVPVIEGVRDPPFGIAFPTDLVVVADEIHTLQGLPPQVRAL